MEFKNKIRIAAEDKWSSRKARTAPVEMLARLKSSLVAMPP
jgi:hypothetical protein